MERSYNNDYKPSYNNRDNGNGYSRGGGGSYGGGGDRHQRDERSSRGGGNGYSREPRDHYGEQYNTQSGQYTEKASNLPVNSTPIQKDFYVEHETTTKRTKEENDAFCDELQIKTIGDNVPRPVKEFEEASLPKYIVNQLKSTAGFERPSPIQSQAWPICLQGRDLIGIAQTGSGKTLSFLLPGIVHIMSQTALKRGDGPIILVMAPTRELAMQIEQQAKVYANVCQLKSLCVYGGAPRYDQQRQLRNGVEILIATPGRLLDFLNAGETNLHRCTYLVLDEADRMLDMGFEKDIRTIISKVTHPERQTLMFSATWPPEVRKLANSFCTMAPIQINIGRDGNQGSGAVANKDICQTIKVLENNYAKYENMCNFLINITENNEKPQKIIIFCATKAGVDKLSESLRYDQNLTSRVRLDVRGIHGDKIQSTRDQIFGHFKIPLTNLYHETRTIVDGQPKVQRLFKSNIMVATDVASRGLDVKDIGVVINYDMPTSIEDYVHRIGRTGRAGAKGLSYSFVTHKEASITGDLIKILTNAKQQVPEELFNLRKGAGQSKQEKKFSRYRNPAERMKNYDSGRVNSQRFDDMPAVSSYPSNGQQSRINFNNGNQDYGAQKPNYVLSGGNVNKRDQKYNDKGNNDYNQGFGGSGTQNYNNNDKW